MERWTNQAANEWWQQQKWPLGINYVTSDAVNNVEMWMDATFNESLIKKELGMARKIGFNSVRVFLSYTVWANEGDRFLENFEKFLVLADHADISVMPVLFDDCAFDDGKDPVYGPQPEPIYGVHNSRWVPSPGAEVQDDPAQTDSLKAYVQTVIGTHKDDKRILVWDLYNEPGNGKPGEIKPGHRKRLDKALPLLKNTFEWARACFPTQPLTAAPWLYSESNRVVEEYCLSQSDVISFHSYHRIDRTLELISEFAKENRPMMVTEWLNRIGGNTIESHLPVFCEKKIGAWQWGMIQGRTQANLSSSTVRGGAPDPDPVLWQHDILYSDGRAYREEELVIIHNLSEKR